MPFLLELPDQYGAVLAAAASTLFVNTVHFSLTMSARKKAKVPYPVAYVANDVADKDPLAHKFNCAQRAHANFTENHTSTLGAILIAGLRWPLATACLGGVWTVSRTLYALGYTSATGPKGRLIGGYTGAIADIVLKVMTGIVAVGFLY